MLDVFLPFQKKEKDKLNKIKDKSTKIKKLSDLYKINKKRASLKTKKKHILKTILWSPRHRFTHLHLPRTSKHPNKPHQNKHTTTSTPSQNAKSPPRGIPAEDSADHHIFPILLKGEDQKRQLPTLPLTQYHRRERA